MSYVSEVNINGTPHKISSTLYGTCGTTASVAEKVVALEAYTRYVVGSTIRVKFSYSNSVANPSLNVNDLGAVPIYRYGTTAPGESAEMSWNAGAVLSFTYDGTAWIMNDWINMSPAMTGATASAAGTAGLAPAPSAGDDTKYLRGDASYSVPGVMTINGRLPDPETGDITVIEGGGSGSYGSYRLDATIPVSAWSGSGPYTTTVTNEYIKSTMDGSETWLENESAMLGETTFTTRDGSLLISTTVKPTAQWVLHCALALNGADVLADMSQSINNLADGIAILSTGNTHAAISAGQAVYVRNHSTLADGLYWANTSIATNATLSTSNLTADASGGLNKLKGDIDSLNSNSMKQFYVNESSAETIESAINHALKSIGTQQYGSPFGFGFIFRDNYYFGIGCYSTQAVSFGRLFTVNGPTVISYRNNNSDNIATISTYTMSNA